MSLGIRCDGVDADFRRCDAELWSLSFNAKPANWAVDVWNEHGDHHDYCPRHIPARAVTFPAAKDD